MSHTYAYRLHFRLLAYASAPLPIALFYFSFLFPNDEHYTFTFQRTNAATDIDRMTMGRCCMISMEIISKIWDNHNTTELANHITILGYWYFSSLLVMLLTEIYANIGTNDRNWLPTSVIFMCVSIGNDTSYSVGEHWTYALNNAMLCCVPFEGCKPSKLIHNHLFIFPMSSTQKPLIHIEIIFWADFIPIGKFPSLYTTATKFNDSYKIASCERLFCKSSS